MLSLDGQIEEDGQVLARTGVDDALVRVRLVPAPVEGCGVLDFQGSAGAEFD